MHCLPMYVKVSPVNNFSKGVWSRRSAMHQEPEVQQTSALSLALQFIQIQIFHKTL